MEDEGVKVRDFLDLKPNERVAILGVGNEFRGDDAAGVEVVERIQGRVDASQVLLIKGGQAPENFASPMRKFKPSHIILVDAVDFGGEPGEIAKIEPREIQDTTTSSHDLSISLLAKYLGEETKAEITVIGIQPLEVSFGDKMTEPVKRAVDELASILGRNLI